MMNNGEGRDGRKGKEAREGKNNVLVFSSIRVALLSCHVSRFGSTAFLPSSFLVIVIGHREGRRVPVLDCLFRILR